MFLVGMVKRTKVRAKLQENATKYQLSLMVLKFRMKN